uniref:M18 family aminopeptidase n=1 Tax=Candidatus Fimenecus sp. TaxID=3022888 RepID=UPI0040258FBA
MTINQFLDTSYTAFHTVANAEAMLAEHGFTKLTLGKDFAIKRGGRYYVTRNDSGIIAFVAGQNNVFNIVESHTDSPSFKVKGNSVTEGNGVVRVNTEKYGGGLLYTYFDRPMKIAGRLLCQTENGLQAKLAVSDYNVVIPSLCIHHNRSANDGFAVNAQVDTLPLLGLTGSDIYSTLTDEKVIDGDLFVVPVTPAFAAGTHNELLCSPRIDNLTSVYSGLSALIAAEPHDIAVCACLDNEEIGSGTRQGSPNWLEQVLCAICDALGLTETQAFAARENGFVLSADNGHAVHPAHPEKSDPYTKAYMGKGVMIKHHVNYSTDGLSSALFKHIASLADVPVQDYYNNSAVSCGSTLGLVTSRTLGMKTCDIGLAQLAMHSACETVALCDVEHMKAALLTFFNVTLDGNNATL